jgi:uncharacterized protein
MKFGLTDARMNEFKAVFAQFDALEAVIIYGSRAKGNYREGSDIDIVLRGNDLTPTHRNAIANVLDDLDTLYMFDVLRLQDIKSPDLLDHIQRVGQVFYERA